MWVSWNLITGISLCWLARQQSLLLLHLHELWQTTREDVSLCSATRNLGRSWNFLGEVYTPSMSLCRGNILSLTVLIHWRWRRAFCKHFLGIIPWHGSLKYSGGSFQNVIKSKCALDSMMTLRVRRWGRLKKEGAYVCIELIQVSLVAQW